MPVIGTGGLSALFEASTDCIQEADTELTLRGLLSIHRRNLRA